MLPPGGKRVSWLQDGELFQNNPSQVTEGVSRSVDEIKLSVW